MRALGTAFVRLQAVVLHDRMAGALLGVAIGDAIGLPLSAAGRMYRAMRSPSVAAAILLSAVAVLVGVDVVGDLASGASGWHVVVELAAVALAVGGAVALGWRARGEVRELRRDLSATLEEAERWRRDAEELLRGLGDAIDEQFARWELTPAEREVGLMLLKGLSLREIAEARGTSERTARQQARAIYAKAGLANRSELAAFFLEDLLLPPRAGAADAGDEAERRTGSAQRLGHRSGRRPDDLTAR